MCYESTKYKYEGNAKTFRPGREEKYKQGQMERRKNN